MTLAVTKLSRLFSEEESYLLLSPGEVLFHQGVPGSHMYVVKYGEADIRVDGRLVGRGVAGNPLGEESLVDNVPRMSSVIAASACKLIVVDRMRLNALVNSTPVILNQLKRLIALRRLVWIP